MGFAIFIVSIFLFFYITALINLKSRLSYDNFIQDDKNIVKRSFKIVSIIGTIGIILTLLALVLGLDPLDLLDYNESDYYALSGFGALSCFIVIIGVWVTTPSKATVKTRDDTKKLDKELDEFTFDKTLYYKDTRFCIDKNKKQIIVINNLAFSYYTIVFSEIIECEILENNITIQKGGVGRAIVGGVLAGGVGAIVGASTRKSKNIVNSLMIRIVTSNINDSLKIINIVSTPISTGSYAYQLAFNFSQDIYSIVISIIADKPKSNNFFKTVEATSIDDILSDIEKISALKDKGIITESEFNAKKQDLLKKIR